MSARKYQELTPWITFNEAVTMDTLWAKLGEAFSKTQHLAGTPLQPSVARELGQVYLSKGALATTAIEGNTLTEDEAKGIVDGSIKMPPSQEYLGQELLNVVKTLEQIDASGRNGARFHLTPEWLKEQNKQILDGLELAPHVIPGEYSHHQLVVGNVYKAAPPEDYEYLVDRLCQWLNNTFIGPSQDPALSADKRFYLAFLGAVLGHLYLVWIHPFGDGNGRTARLLEVAALSHSGVIPWVSSNLLSDHYNKTRTRYYTRLQNASQRGQVREFIEYSTEGFVDMLREQIQTVQTVQRRTAWVNYIHEVMHAETTGKTKERRRDVVLAMGEIPVAKSEIRKLNAEIAEQYAGKEERTLSRDLGALERLGLIEHVDGRGVRARYRARVETMDAFKPL